MAQHQREQPDDPLDARLVREHRLEMRESTWARRPGGVSKQNWNGAPRWPDLAQQVGKDGIPPP
jgi:hypothetical protein